MSFENIKKNFGFGCMRLKMNGEEVDYAEFCRMIDAFMAAGFNYFDTAHGYIGGKSEKAIRDCLVPRYPRESFVLTNKLSSWYYNTEEDILPLFESQLSLTGVTYFDFYLLHAVNHESYEKIKSTNAIPILKGLKAEGKIRHIGMSFHDSAEVLDRILTEQPDIEVVQLQINYLDMDDPGVQSAACYEVAKKHGKKVIVMEPVKGGTLANLSERAKNVLAPFGEGSPASFALRFVASMSEVIMVLSGMGNMEMMLDNLHTMGDFVPVGEAECEALCRVRDIIREENQIPCTSCNYCFEVCPKKIEISSCFRAYNAYAAAKISEENAEQEIRKGKSLPSDCIRCGACEKVCPQGIDIREKLAMIHKKVM
ncbi:MAG: aldo/keto reductase [Clostridia bacterium]|nr:aldo/keto reductase [Clostridia bacterium]